ncbi:dihydroorotase [Candidatus Peregrinibacteria bacterium]|nr:dihydroorotase [Candidatus Peregrinibacteria bacterium]
MSKILLKNGRIIDPETKRDEVTDILIEDDKISAIGKIEPEMGMNVIDVTGKLVIPGVIDLHVHLRDMDQADKETIETGTRAARNGGITTVFCMPNTSPKLDCMENIDRYLKLIQDARINVQIVGAITKKLMGEELADIIRYPRFGIKFITDDGFDIDDEGLLEKAYEKAKQFDLIVMTHPEIMSIAPNGLINKGKVSEQLNVEGQPNEKEWKAVERGIRLALKTGARAHFTHLSTKESVDLIRKAKMESALITADATPHHITFTEDEVLVQGSQAKVNPPLRTEEDRLAVIGGLKDGTLDCIVTDHAPHTAIDKNHDLASSAFGFSGLEISVPATITELHFKQGMELVDVIGLMTIKPAKLANLPVGRLQTGFQADITVLDIETDEKVSTSLFVSKGKNSPFNGKVLKGWPVMTLVKGMVFEN